MLEADSTKEVQVATKTVDQLDDGVLEELSTAVDLPIVYLDQHVRRYPCLRLQHAVLTMSHAACRSVWWTSHTG
jgi:hypothetical protein